MKLTHYALLVCLLAAGCTNYLPDARVVGNFRASGGETIEVLPNGRIFYSHAEKKEFFGMVTVTRDTPLTIYVVAPDTSPLVGTVIIFSADRQRIEVEWPNWRDALRGRGPPTRFQRTEDGKS